MDEQMIKLDNWTEKSKGYYIYPIAPGCAYEIIIKYWSVGTPILTANADLYIVGEWCSKSGNFLESELLLNGPVCACLEKAIEDNNENNTES